MNITYWNIHVLDKIQSIGKIIAEHLSKTMKVIFAGMSKTGTKSMRAALTILGYNVFDYMKNCEFLSKEWTKIMEEGGTVEDFRKMYENVDAITGVPGCMFWEEISEAFPDAKIVFSMRNEEDWIKSVKAQEETSDAFYVKLLMMMSPTCWTMNKYNDAVCMSSFGFVGRKSLFQKSVLNETLMRKAYRKHNTYILEKAPKDRFLLFSPKDGWAPLCHFLGVDVPNTPYPHKNKGDIMKELLETNKLLIRVQREMMFTCGITAVLLVYGGYKVATGKASLRHWIAAGTDYMASVLLRLKS